MPVWDYDAAQYEEKSYQLIPVGEYRVRIDSAIEQQSRTGKDMVKIVLDVNGYSSKLFYYLVFDPSNSKMTNQNLGAIYDSFAIPEGNLNIAQWVGKVGACKVKHEIYNGDDTAKVHYFIPQSKQDDLPKWSDGNVAESLQASVMDISDVSSFNDDVDIPF